MADDTVKPRPWWAPDMQTFLAMGIISICGAVVFVRMFREAPPADDKILDTMITILFSTCLVTVYNYSFGSSRGSQSKDDTQNKIVERLANAPIPPTPPADAAAPVVAWWSLLTPAEQARITGAAANDQRVATFIGAAQAGKASEDDLGYLVSKTLLTDARAKLIAAA